MTQHLLHFLLVFDHEAGSLIELNEFSDDGDAAIIAYAEREQQYQDRRSIEIVLIGSDSLKTVQLTHANYFDGSVAVSKYLAGI
ncbi:MAG: hypothetical protein ACYCXY_13810 [Acidimicrobiales bacterium]